MKYDPSAGCHPASKLKFDLAPGSSVAVDFETYYDSASKYSLRNLAPYDYVHHRQFDPYMVSIVAENGDEFVGDPAKFEWGCLEGMKLIAHNAAFDAMVLYRMIELGRVPKSLESCEWYCTADMAAFLSVPRNLKDAVHYLLGITLSKKVRASMDGKSLRDAVGAGLYDELLDYAADDARYCMELWNKYSDKWPPLEREISRQNRESCWRGVRIDRDALEKGLAKFKEVQSAAGRNLPWTSPERDEDYRKPGSVQALAAHARGLGLDVPSTFNKNSEEMQEWVARYKDRFPFIQARLDHASVTPHIARLESMKEIMDDQNILRFGMRYCGAHTGRASAGGSDGDSEKTQTAKFNILNIPRSPKDTFGVDLRGMIIPRPGRVFMIYDFAQIEPRLTHWVAGNAPFLALAAKEDIYQANAKVMGWYPMDRFNLGEEDFQLRQVSKKCVIALGYGMGASKFWVGCKQDGVKLPPIPKTGWDFLPWDLAALARMELNPDDPKDEEEICEFMGAVDIVRKWREKNKPVRDLWKHLQRQMEQSAARKEMVHEFVLPSGRVKPYFEPRLEPQYKLEVDPETGELETAVENRLFAAVVRGRKRSAYHGGIITENLIQALARDVMFTGAVDVCKAAPHWWFDWNAYDEVIFEVPEDEADDAARVIPECLCNGSVREWIGDLHLEVSGGKKHRYCK